ncbi:MAG TPA: 6-carboxytetrahydropterin synthase [Candidatus Eisenbacteria bacterium]|nr:6-carboxytetrahydropterin synthase [Candidatus Eisenbacteria bacterium]
MFEVTVEDEFSAAHFLKLYDGTWEHRHGHNWKVAVTMRSEKLDSMGVVVDFEALKPALKKTLKEISEMSINQHPAFRDGQLNPSTENIAKFIHDRLAESFKSSNARAVKVTVWETPDASATYYA